MTVAKTTASLVQVKPAALNATAAGIKKIYFLMLGVIGILSIPALIIFVLGTLPAFTVWKYDQTPQKSFALTIGFMNVAGAVPFVLNILPNGQKFFLSNAVLSNPKTWAIIYIAALMGWAILQILPSVFSYFLTARLKNRQQAIREEQQDLTIVWGEGVKSGEKFSTRHQK